MLATGLRFEFQHCRIDGLTVETVSPCHARFDLFSVDMNGVARGGSGAYLGVDRAERAPVAVFASYEHRDGVVINHARQRLPRPLAKWLIFFRGINAGHADADWPLIYQQLERVAIENADDLADQFRRLRAGCDLLPFCRRSGLLPGVRDEIHKGDKGERQAHEDI